jgi:hypothetical protein
MDISIRRHYGQGFVHFMKIWFWLGFAGLIGIMFYLFTGIHQRNDPITMLGAISLVVFGLALFSLPSMLAYATVHPSRTGIYFVNWFLGWTGILWLGALIWALVGFNDRLSRLEPLYIDEESGESSTIWGFVSITCIVFVGLGVWHWCKTRSGNEVGLSGLTYALDDLPGEKVTAQGISKVPGALICQDYATLSSLMRLYGEAWEEQTQDRLMAGRERPLKGVPMEYPDPTDYNCVLVPSGRSMAIERGGIVPKARVYLEDGEVYSGVTNPYMFVADTASVQSQTQPQAIENASLPNVTTETPAVKFNGAVTPTAPPAEAAPAPILRLTQSTLPNGDIILSSPSGLCATIMKPSATDSSWLRVTFEDGTTKIIDGNEIEQAAAAATEHCQSGAQ